MSQSPNDLTFNVKASTDAPSIQYAAREAREVFEREFGEGIHGQLEKANELFGRSSTFGHVLHAAEGGGALFGVGLLGRELSEGTEKLKELVEKFDEGKITGGQMVDEIAKGLPLLGNFYSATRNIVDLMSGELEIQRELAQLDKERAEFRKHDFEAIKAFHDQQREFTKSIIASENATANTYLEGPSRTIAQLRQGIDERHRTQKEDLNDALIKAKVPDLQAELEKRQSEINAIHKQIEQTEKEKADQQRRIANGEAKFSDAYYPERERHRLEERAKSLQSHLEELNTKQATQQKVHDEQLQKTTDSFNADLLRKDQQAEEEITKLREDQQKQRKAVLEAGEKRIQDTLAHARAAGLTEERQQYEAHLTELKQSLADALADLNRKTRDQIQKDLRDTTFSLFPTRAGQVGTDIFMGLREAAADYQNFTAQSGASKKQFDEQERVKTQEREAQLAKANLDVLRAQAEVGDRTAKLEIEKLEAAQKYRDLQRELLSIMENPAMSGDARAAASHQLGMLPLLMAQAIAGIHDTRPLPGNLAHLQTISGRGSAAAAGALGHAQEEAQLVSQRDPQREIAKAVQDLVTELKKLPTPKVIADAVKEGLSALGFKTDDNGSNLFGF